MSKPELPAACIPCRSNTQPLTEDEVSASAPTVPDWRLADDRKSISRTFAFMNYQAAVDFIVATAAIAEAQGHHPEHRLFQYKRLTFTLTTYAAGGLTANDFVMARFIDQAWEARA